MNELAKEIHEIAVSKDFWSSERNTGELLMLVVSELGEALEADRKSGVQHFTEKYLVDMLELSTSHSENFNYAFKYNVKDCFQDEIADAIIRLLDMCAAFNIDIEKHIRLKMEYNKTRERLHGKKY